MTVLGPPEIDYLRERARVVALRTTRRSGDAIKAHLGDKDLKKNLQALERAAGLDAALGRIPPATCSRRATRRCTSPTP
ncbi:MAG: hypothetical protein R3F65_31970 [bacterium]